MGDLNMYELRISSNLDGDVISELVEIGAPPPDIPPISAGLGMCAPDFAKSMIESDVYAFFSYYLRIKIDSVKVRKMTKTHELTCPDCDATFTYDLDPDDLDPDDVIICPECENCFEFDYDEQTDTITLEEGDYQEEDDEDEEDDELFEGEGEDDE